MTYRHYHLKEDGTQEKETKIRITESLVSVYYQVSMFILSTILQVLLPF